MPRRKLRHCVACQQDKPWEQFPRYMSYAKKQWSSWGKRCFACGSKPTRDHVNLDARFAALEPEHGVCHDLLDIAEKVGCSRTLIQLIEARALAKLRNRAPWLATLLEGR